MWSSEAELWHFQLHATTSFIVNEISGGVLIVFDSEVMVDEIKIKE